MFLSSGKHYLIASGQTKTLPEDWHFKYFIVDGEERLKSDSKEIVDPQKIRKYLIVNQFQCRAICSTFKKVKNDIKGIKIKIKKI